MTDAELEEQLTDLLRSHMIGGADLDAVAETLEEQAERVRALEEQAERVRALEEAGL